MFSTSTETANSALVNNTLTTPSLIMTNEQSDMMNSIVHILKESGFQLRLVKGRAIERFLADKQMPREIKQLDALAILRYVRETCNPASTVVILCA